MKNIVSMICRLLILPLYALVRLMELFIKTDQPFQLGAHTVSLIPGFVGNYFRKEYYRLSLQKCASDVCIEFGTILNQPTVELGRRVYIGTNCSIGECKIEDDVLIGSNVDIISGKQQHGFTDIETSVREQKGRLEKIVIGKDSWIGNSSVLMANVSKKCIVGAGSVVTKDIPPFSIVAGNPAKVLKSRREE